MKLKHILNEIVVNTPSRMAFDIHTRENAPATPNEQELVLSIKEGSRQVYSVKFEVYIESTLYNLILEIKGPYNIELQIVKVTEDTFQNVNTHLRQWAEIEMNRFNQLVEICNKGKIPYKIRDYSMFNWIGPNVEAKILYISLNEVYVKTHLRVNGKLFKNL